MKSRYGILVALPGVLLSIASCVRESVPPCPSEGGVVVEVRDKNYRNAQEVPGEPVAENLPMASYIRSLVTWNHPAGSGDYDVYDETIAAGEFTHELSSSYFAVGANEVTSVGNENLFAQEFGRDANTLPLHPEGVEYTDTYIGTARVTAPPDGYSVIPMSRAKGKLIVEPLGVPATVTSVEISVGSVYASAEAVISAGGGNTGAGYDILYYGSATVEKTFTPAASYAVWLAPSIAPAGTSPVSMTFRGDGGDLPPLAFDVVMTRNRITLVRPQYEATTKTWTLKVMVDGKWVAIENLQLS